MEVLNGNLVILSKPAVIDASGLNVVAKEFSNTITELESGNIVITKDNIQEWKDKRSSFRKNFEEIDKARITVSKEINKPYEDFKNVYDAKIKDPFGTVDTKLKFAIDQYENNLKIEIEKGNQKYFEELKTKHNLDFIQYKDAKVNVTLTASKVSLVRAVDEFINGIVTDLEVINAEDDDIKPRIMVRYKETLNLGSSLKIVKEQVRKEKEEKLRQEAEKARQEEFKINIPADMVLRPLKQPEKVVETPPVNVVKEKPIYEFTFSVKATETQARQIVSLFKELKVEYKNVD